MPDPAHNTQLNKEFRLHMASILYFLSRIAVVGFVFAIPALYFIRGQLEMPLLAGGAIFVIALLIGYYVAASSLRCSACSGPVLMDNGHRKHPHAQKLPGINHRARVAWDILFSSSYQCMYCNTRCRCKKNWSGKAKPVVPKGRGSNLFNPPAGPAAAAAETFPESIFGDLSPLGEAQIVEESGTAGGAGIPERIVRPSYTPASVFPGVRTVPITIVPAEPPVVEQSPASPVPHGEIIEVSNPEPPASPFPANPKAPAPWTTPVPAISSEPVTPMNRPTQDPQTVHGSNPFLAAASAMPLPTGPILPPIPQSHSTADGRPLEAGATGQQEFPYTGTPTQLPADGPPPWTLPCPPAPTELSAPVRPAPLPAPEVPVAVRVPGIITAPVLPPVPMQAPAAAPAAQVNDYTPSPAPAFAAPAPAIPAPGIPVQPAPVPASVAPAPVQQVSATLPVDLLKDVVSVLEDGRRALTDAFQGLIDRLEARLAAAPQPVAAPAMFTATAPQPSPQVFHPASLVEHAIAAPVDLPIPVSVAAAQAPEAETVPHLIPPAPPVQPAAAAEEPSLPAAPRRRFARPTGAAAQQLTSALSEVFETPAAPAPAPVMPPPPAPVHGNGQSYGYSNGNSNGYNIPVQENAPAPVRPPQPRVLPPPSPFELASPAPAPAQPTRHPQARTESIASPFAIADAPLTSRPEMPAAPAPFTFLKNEGDHFAPASQDSPALTGDSLDDTLLPWMQPVTGRA